MFNGRAIFRCENNSLFRHADNLERPYYAWCTFHTSHLSHGNSVIVIVIQFKFESHHNLQIKRNERKLNGVHMVITISVQHFIISSYFIDFVRYLMSVCDEIDYRSYFLFLHKLRTWAVSYKPENDPILHQTINKLFS